MKLVPEQISELRKEKIKSKKALADYDDYLKSKEITSSDYSSRALIGDSLTDQQYNMEHTHYNEVSTLLAEAEYVTERSTDKIDIGTKFIIEYEDNRETAAMILTDCIFGLSYNNHFISVESPVGKAVIGKQAGETFRTEVITSQIPRNKRVITGTVVKIITDPKEYLHFIREKEEKNRICTLARKERKELLSSSSEEAKEEYNRRQEITESQRNLLLLELERLSRKPSTKESTNRLAHIRRLLATTKVATPPTDGTIGIGSSFDIVVTDGENSETRHYEMINRAVSDELEDAYVERIDTLGSKLYGLKQNDTIRYMKDGKTYKVAVMNVEVDETSKKDTLTPSYQYTKK